MHNEIINILIASDINYAPYYGVMLTSLFINNKDCRFDIHLLTDSSWTDSKTKQFETLSSKYNSQFNVYRINEQMMEKYPLRGHLRLSTYYNLCAPDFLPASIHKILYLDGDMIVNGDIRPLWNIDIDGYACAMVPNCTFFDQSYYDRLQYNRTDGYYNNGATIYNLDYLRESHFVTKAFEYINNHADRIVWMDQDVQNALLHDVMLSLPFEYNFQALFFMPSKWETYPHDFREEVLNAAEKPVILHYSGRCKPWQFQYYMMPYGTLWNKYRRLSMWTRCVCRKPLKMYIKHLMKRVIKPSSLLDERNKEFIPESLRFS